MSGAAYVGAFAYALGDVCETVGETGRAGRLVSPPEALRRGGFERHYRCSSRVTHYDLARRAVQQLDGALGSIDAIVYATCIPENGSLGDRSAFEKSGDVRYLMNFPASRLQSELDIDAPVIGLNQQACTGMLGALRLARNWLCGEPSAERILCVTADRFPPGARYEQAYNLISDGAAACIVTRTPATFRIVACHQITNGALALATADETLGSYFSYSKLAIEQTLQRAGLSVRDIDWIVPQNTHRDAWRILSGLIGFPPERVMAESLPSVGHIISADNVANLSALRERLGSFAGARVLLTMTGYGSNWQCVILEGVS
jgi:3-oxoacyl-[acyl-carrier-protein] synthase-3